MKITITTPLGENLVLTAPDNAPHDEIQAQLDSAISQYEAHTSPSQLRMKTGKPLVEPEPPAPGFVERTKAEFGAGLDEFRQGLRKLKQGGGPLLDPNLTARPKVDLSIPPLIAGPMRAVNAPVTAVGHMAGEATLGATDSPFAATVVDVGVQQLALAGMGRATEALKAQRGAAVGTGLGEGARELTAAENIALETGTPVTAGQEIPLPNKYAPLAARARQTPAEIGAAAVDATEGGGPATAFGAKAAQTFEDLKRSMFDEAPPDPVVTKRGRKGKVVHNAPDGRAVVAGDDGITTIEDPKSLRLAPSDVPEEAKIDTPQEMQTQVESIIKQQSKPFTSVKAGTFRGELEGGYDRALMAEGVTPVSRTPLPSERTKTPPAKIQTKPPTAPEPTAGEELPPEDLDRAVNMKKPPLSAALHAREAPAVGLRPAIRNEGKVYAGNEGEVHNDILARIPGGKELQQRIAEGRESEGSTHGFVTKNGLFLSRQEATELYGTSKDVKAGTAPAAPVQSAKRLAPAPEVAPAPPPIPASEEVKAMLPEARRAGTRAAGKLGKKLDPYSIAVGREVDTARGPGKIENFNINDDGDFLFDVRLANGKLVKVPNVFDILRSEKGAATAMFVPQLAQAAANKAVTAATNLSKEWLRPLFSPATVSEDAAKSARTLRRRLGELHADHSVTEHRFQEVESFLDTFSAAEQAAIHQRFHAGVPQVGPHAAELNKIDAQFRDAIKRRERYYVSRGWQMDTQADYVASLFKDNKRAEQFANIVTARDKDHARVASALQSLGQQQREDFFNRMMVGRAQGAPILTASAERIAPFFRTFKEPGNAKRAFDRFYGPRGVAGSRQAHYNFFTEGLMSELEPVSYNPARLVESRLHQMDKRAMKDKLLYDMRNDIVFVKTGQAKPLDFAPLKYHGESTVAQAKYFQPYITGRKGERGEWYAPKDIARIVNNELEPGFRGQGWYDKTRDLTMLQTMSRLGLSGFHATEIALTAPVTAMGHAWKDLINEKSLKAAGNFAKQLGTLGSVESYRYWQTGRAIRNEFFEKWGTDNPVSDALKYVIATNMRVGHDEQYATQWSRAYMRAMNEGSYGRAALEFYPRLLEKISGPLFNHLIPNLKIGAMVKKMERELAAMPPGSTYDHILERLMPHADEVDNTFGMVNYDNYHLKKGFRDALFVGFQAPGWFLGSYRQAKGAVGEVGKTISDLVTGKGLQIGDKTAFWLGMATIHPIATMIMQYALTRTFPKVDPNSMRNTARNFLTHEDGTTRPDGSPGRSILPGYHKELWHMIGSAAEGPVGIFNYLYGKTSGLVQDTHDLLVNRDFNQNQIMTPPRGYIPEMLGGPGMDIRGIAKAAGQAALHELGSPIPISLRAAGRATREAAKQQFEPNRTMMGSVLEAGKTALEHPVSTAINVVGGLAGEVNAPAYMTRSPLMAHLLSIGEKRGRTVEQATRASQRYDLTIDLRKAKTPAERTRLQAEAQTDKDLKPSDIQRATREAHMSPLALATQQVPLPDLIGALRYGTPEERKELMPIISKKWNSSIKDYMGQAKEMAAELAKYQVGR